MPTASELAWRRVSLVAETAAQLPAGWARARTQTRAVTPGVNLTSFAPRMHQSARSVSRVIDQGVAATGLPYGWFSDPHQGRAALAGDPDLTYAATIAHVQPSTMPIVAARTPRLFRRGGFVACVCYWETTEVKRLHRLGMPFLDEIWTLSEFCQDVFSAITDKPVRVMPYPFDPPVPSNGELRAHLGLDDEFLFAFQFDTASTTERKNPQGVIEAYKRAFPHPQADTRLLIKTMNPDWYPAATAELERLTAEREDILFVTEYWPEDVNSAFYSDLDCYVSLHRAEGLGIGMARAMAAGKPVIATGYSGNLTFMSDENAVLVPYQVVKVGPNPVYAAESRWAEPDLDAAADAMRQVRDDAGLRERLGVRAAADIAARTPEAFGEWMLNETPLGSVAR